MQVQQVIDIENGFIVIQGDIGRIIYNNGDAEDINNKTHPQYFKAQPEPEISEKKRTGFGLVDKKEKKVKKGFFY